MGVVKVACHHVGGLSIRLTRQGWDDGTGDGVRPTVPVGSSVTLAGPDRKTALGTSASSIINGDEPGITMVNEEWMNEWIAQNRGKNPFLDLGIIQVVT